MTDENPLAILTQAERQLSQASDIVDILTLRTKAKAIEVIGVAQGFGEIAQRAKLFQLRAERKAGDWLSDNIRPGKPSHDERVTIADLDIDYNDSSRWQLMAKLPEDKFCSWVDDRIQRGFEITAGGLRQYTRNYLNKYQATNSRGEKVDIIKAPTRTLYLKPPDGVCSLTGYAIWCDGPLQGHHMINKGKVGGNAEARKILVACPDEIMADVCVAHNIGRMADTPEARKILLLQKIHKYGYNHMKEWFEVFLSTFKVRPHEWELEVLLS